MGGSGVERVGLRWVEMGGNDVERVGLRWMEIGMGGNGVVLRGWGRDGWKWW